MPVVLFDSDRWRMQNVRTDCGTCESHKAGKENNEKCGDKENKKSRTKV